MPTTAENVITIGRPVLYLANAQDVIWNSHFPIGQSYVQLYYLKADRIVNLFRGEHPRLIVKGSDLHLTLDYRGNSEDDIAKLIDEAVRREVTKILGKSRIEVSQGEFAPTGRNLFYHPKIVIDPPIKGLQIDPARVIIHRDHFVP